MKNTEEEIYKYFGDKKKTTTFTWNRYCGQRGTSVMTIFDHKEGNIFNQRFVCEGWCYGNKLEVRPKNDGIAVMRLDTEYNEKVWCHVSEDLVQTLIRYTELYKT